MPLIHFDFPKGATLRELFDDMPKSMAARLKKGLKQLMSLSESQHASLVEQIFEVTAAEKSPAEQTLLRNLGGLQEREALSLFMAAGMVASIVSTQEVKPDELLALLVDHQLVEDAENAGILRFIKMAESDRRRLGRKLAQSRLQQDVLPSLTAVELAIDVRHSLETDERSVTVPVLLMHVDTDAAHVELWLQLTVAQVAALAEDLNKALDRLKKLQD